MKLLVGIVMHAVIFGLLMLTDVGWGYAAFISGLCVWFGIILIPEWIDLQ